MGLFDVFSFKKEASKVLTKESFTEILELARIKIAELAKANFPGEEKKKQVDAIVVNRIYDKVKEANIKNKLVLWIVEKLIDLIPRVVQLVYNFLKEKVENL